MTIFKKYKEIVQVDYNNIICLMKCIWSFIISTCNQHENDQWDIFNPFFILRNLMCFTPIALHKTDVKHLTGF